MDLTLKPLNILIGPNGAGKSNFLSVFEMLNEIVKENLQLYVGKSGGADNLLYFGRKTTDAIEITLTFPGSGQGLSSGYRCRLIPSQQDTLVFGSEVCWFHDRSRYSTPHEIDLGSGHTETHLTDQPKTVEGYVLGTMRD